MASPRAIYLLSAKEFSPETIAVAFAKTSRAPESFREIAAGLTEESSAQFHEKWVVGYGHASVAEHAVLHIAFENVSRLAVECIESNRLASYTEKSTRYQKWGVDDFLVPVELDGQPLRDEYTRTCQTLFRAYADALEVVRTLVAKKNPPHPGESQRAWDRRIRSQYADACRFLLPAASLANLGMTANARLLEGAIRKMLSHPLAEVRQIGGQVKEIATGEVPTLVRYAEAQDYLTETAGDLTSRVTTWQGAQEDWCTLVDFDCEAEVKVLAAALYRFANIAYSQAVGMVRAQTERSRGELAEALLGRLGRHDVPLRELEHCSYTFDLVMDQGAYAEFKRHRMMTQTPQGLTAALGYALPRLITEAGFEDGYRAALGTAAETWEKLYTWNPHIAQYVVPNAFNRRVLATFNLREAYHFCRLRSAVNAHFSIRRVALRMAEQIARVHPLLAKYMNLPEGEDWQEIEAQYFAGL